MFKFFITLSNEVTLPNAAAENEGTVIDRETFYAWLWDHYGARGLAGVHEGTLLSEEVAAQGIETESWVVDSGMAPRERDWVGQLGEACVEVFFERQDQAEQAQADLLGAEGLQVGPVQEQKSEDWDASWKASFLNNGNGIELPPFWHILPPWVAVESSPSRKIIRVNPGAGFGTGTHETTQLCLQAIGEIFAAGRVEPSGARALDFGSGSGILAIGLALLGAKVDAVEIDPLAIDNARHNADLNHCSEAIVFSTVSPMTAEPYSVVAANILKPVLLEFSEELVYKLAPGGVMILSGLIEQDVQPVLERYSVLLAKRGLGLSSRVLAKQEWRAILFS